MKRLGRLIAALVLLPGALLLLAGCERAEQEPPPPPEPTTEPQPAEPPPPQPEAAPPADQTQAPPAGEQPPPDGEQAQAEPPPPGDADQAAGGDVQQMMQQAGCFACHDMGTKKIGPAYAWISQRYQGEQNAAEALTNSIRNGSQGKWQEVTGGVPMPPNPQLSEEQARQMADWILEQEPQQPPG